ncbi:hypothetical protein RHSIM_RhsimUnG0193800 [Rhododendron simsii]|uniref:Cytochrome P450 n=1 Tax=Rhododendron simsii TaxID=118357 RepID=A0A834FUH3_RHOSS|nr:hypothetical protein RHSIM_RhsimUnG0193800 [Rhododendron simsii]
MYRTLESLSKKYGPILTLRFGSRPVLVLSSPSAVKELFSRNDLVFANRPRVLFGELLNYNSTTLGTTSYGDHWRNLRRISTLEMLSAAKLNSNFGIRQEEVQSLLKNLFRNSREDFVKVEMKSRLSELTFNIITRMVVGTKYFGNEAEDSLDATEFRRIISDILSYATLNQGDYVPFFRWIDFRNVKRRMLKIHKKMDVFMQGLIDENRRRDKEVSEQNGGKTKSMIDTMLGLQGSDPQYYSDEIIKGHVQCFEWVRIGEELVDMSEGINGVTIPKAKPLEAMCRARKTMINVLSEL